MNGGRLNESQVVEKKAMIDITTGMVAYHHIFRSHFEIASMDDETISAHGTSLQCI